MVIAGSQLVGELLAENTTESLRILRDGDWVYKFLRPDDTFRQTHPRARRRQIWFRVWESRRWAELNPLVYHEATNCLVSRFLVGNRPTQDEVDRLARRLTATGRGYIGDLGVSNIVLVHGRPILIDFVVNERHPDFPGRPQITFQPHARA